jgi:hypothetical protein
MIEVFKTNVEEIYQAKNLVDLLLQHFPGSKINFDLHDCDKILRVEGDNFATDQVMILVERNGFVCEVLE